MTGPPAPGHADVWYACPEAVGEAQRVALARLLSPDERARAESVVLAEARERFIVTRALLRLSLSRYAAVPPEAWVFTRSPHGKPLLDARGPALDLHFNVSHTPGLSVCAIAASAVGIDVQDTTRPPPWRVIDRYLAPAEREGLAGLPEPERAARFFEYWTLKEAYVKARGLGFWLPLAQIGFRREASLLTLELGAGCPDDGHRYWLESWQDTPRHRLALALQDPGRALGRGDAGPRAPVLTHRRAFA